MAFNPTFRLDMATGEKWHHHYDDPRDDIVLFTTDNINFRVSSRLLCKHSAHFKSLIAPSDDPNIDVKPSTVGHDSFQVNISAVILEFFLGMLPHTTRKLILAGLTFDQCKDLLTFTEGCKCEHMIPLVRTQLILKAVGPGEPTALLLFASSRDDWALGKSALQNMDEDEVLRTTGSRHNRHAAEKNITAFLAKLRPDWQQKLTSILFVAYFKNSSAIKDWSLCADKFDQPDKALKRPRSDAPADAAAKKVRGGKNVA